MREKAEAVKAERDGLRREVDVLAETLRAMTAGLHERKEQHREERTYVDATAGRARMVATLINPTRAHGGIVLVETTYGDRRDVETLHLDAWRSRVSRMINAGCSSEWLWVEQSIIEALTNVVRYLNAPAERTA